MEGEVEEFASKLPLFVRACVSRSHPVHHSPSHSPAFYSFVDILFSSSVVFSARIGDPSYCRSCLRLSFAPEMVLLIQLSSSSSFSHELEFGLVSI